jgi:hypothetical protein
MSRDSWRLTKISIQRTIALSSKTFATFFDAPRLYLDQITLFGSAGLAAMTLIPPRDNKSAAPARRSRRQAALQRFQALEPAPFVPQRLGPDLLEAPKPPTARPRVVATACALAAAPFVGAEAERSQQIALRAPDQIVARGRWARQPLFEREPPRKASRGSALHGLDLSLHHHRLDLSLRHHRA